MKTQNNQRRNVAVIIETSNDYARGILKGVHEYQLSRPGWHIYLSEHRRHEPVESYVGDWDCHGVIARIESPSMAEVIKTMGVPIVDAGSARLIPKIPWVAAHDGAIARLAVSHLLDCGLPRIAFFGDRYYDWSRWRGSSFVQLARRSGVPHFVYELPDREDRKVWWHNRRDSIIRWVDSLPKPVGVFACSDYYAHRLLEVCKDSGIVVPHDVAVIGVDNDELICELSHPPLSSVIPNTRLTGMKAAEHLDRLMNGQEVNAQRFSIPPISVQERASTDSLAVLDSHVARAMGYIQQHAIEKLSPDDVARHVGLSRRSLEGRFRQALNRTPYQQIARVRLNKIRELLSKTDMTLAEIAEALNIPHSEYLSVFFKKQTGKTPSEYRVETGRRTYR